MKKEILICFLLAFLFTSCNSSRYVSSGKQTKVKEYTFIHSDVPASFDGFKIIFVSDFHYKSKFREKQLERMVKTINAIEADLLLMGGDYQSGCEYVSELARYLGEVNTPFGKIGVMGNHDYKRCYEEIIEEMGHYGIKILEHANDTIHKDNEQIIISGVRDPFNLKENGISPTLQLSPDDFVILLTHTPDYVEDVDISNADLALAGHTHGGQVTFFGIYAPKTNSQYGQRFVKGQRKNSVGIPVIITKGLGTSRKNVRLFASAEIVLITLQTAK